MIRYPLRASSGGERSALSVVLRGLWGLGLGWTDFMPSSWRMRSVVDGGHGSGRGLTTRGRRFCISIPHIHGVTTPGPTDSVLAAWQQPVGDYPSELWPSIVLGDFRHKPTEWITVSQHGRSGAGSDGRATVMVSSDDERAALGGVTWIGRQLGGCYGGEDQKFESGLHEPGWRGPPTDFLVQVTRPSGASDRVVDVSQPFVWFWDAYPVHNGWDYVDNAGDPHELIRTEVEDDRWRVRIRALELRKFLLASDQSALVQVDIVRRRASEEFARVDDELRLDWCSMDFYAVHDAGFRSTPISRVLGRYLVNGADGPRKPRPDDWEPPHGYLEFVYGVGEDGHPLRHTANPDELGTYFDRDEDAGRLHYLTTVCFKPEVLERYAAEPMRYRLTSSRLECLDLWGVSIGRTSTGLVEVYLGDIGRDIPHQHWAHWLQHNVPPEGDVDEGRFRRDILNQSVSSSSAVDQLRQARQAANAAAVDALGAQLWRDPSGLLARQHDSLVGPVRDDPSRLHEPLMVLSKVYVDSLDERLLRACVESPEPNARSLSLLGTLLTEHGSSADQAEPLRALQSYRSRGGVAHRTSDADAARAADRLNVAGLSAPAAFERVVAKVTEAVEHVGQVLSTSAVSR